jgi:hypothetical protein
MRTIDSQDLDRFIASLRQMSEKCGHLKAGSVDANNFMLTTAVAGHPEMAFMNGIATASKLIQSYEELLADFEIHAEKCLGERRKDNECARVFVDRIGAMSTAQLLTTMRRNQICLL